MEIKIFYRERANLKGKMNLLKILEWEAQIQFKPFGVKTTLTSNELSICLENPSLTWREERLLLEKLPVKWDGLITAKKQTLTLNDENVKNKRLFGFQNIFEDVRELLLKENLQLDFWNEISNPFPTGFEEGTLPNTKAHLDRLYSDKKVVAEKKAFLVELNKCAGPYLIADEAGYPAINDAASQIASMALGHNHKSRSIMPLRSEVQDQDLDLTTWDIAKSFKRIVREQSKLKHVYLCNSGAEAMEIAVQSCQSVHPTRRKIIAFEGSFHGRTLLALHATFNPSKRLPFQIYNDLVDFVPFPEDKNPKAAKAEPAQWIDIWRNAAADNFEKLISTLAQQSDELLKLEIDSLIKIRESIIKEAPLCVIVEPMQCEGGDRYGSSRYFRALRLLTRAFDCPLVMDEVQTGFGLGRSFFWHRDFNLPEAPDAIYQAKKSQSAFCATQYELKDFREEACPASIYRGYLQAVELLDQDSSILESKVENFLTRFKEFVGGELISHPRNCGYAFAFDLPSAEILNAFVKARFKHGLLFYPAGDVTARFRLLTQTSDTKLFEIFRGLILCLKDLEVTGQLTGHLTTKIPDVEQWDSLFPELHKDWRDKPRSQELKSPWPESLATTPAKEWGTTFKGSWEKCFQTILTKAPQMIRTLAQSPFRPRTPPNSFNDIYQWYLEGKRTTKLDLLMNCSRFLGVVVKRADKAMLESYSSQIDALEKKSYEEGRQTLTNVFLRNIEDHKTIVLLALDKNQKLIGICAAAPAHHFKDVPKLGDDNYFEDDANLYSFDLTIDKDSQGVALGYRLKAEQLICSFAQGSHQIKSRNRYPESSPMARLNYRLGHGAVLKEENQYGGQATALYQSFCFYENPPLRVGDSKEACLKNKLTLSNFVTSEYCDNMSIVSEFFPARLRHFYLSSGRAEAADKMIRLLRNNRPTGIKAASLRGSYFGNSTAVARSLGGPHALKYFAWPVFEKAKELEVSLSEHGADTLLGFFASHTEKPSVDEISNLKEFYEVCKSFGLPFITASETTPLESVYQDAHLMYGKGQLGLVAVSEKLFFDKPLQMISTWDGDEWSLARLKDTLLLAT